METTNNKEIGKPHFHLHITMSFSENLPVDYLFMLQHVVSKK